MPRQSLYGCISCFFFIVPRQSLYGCIFFHNAQTITVWLYFSFFFFIMPRQSLICCFFFPLPTNYHRQMQDEFSSYQESVKKLSEETKKTGQILDDGAVCEICHKTKFADGVGHSCHFCFKKSCARCGGRMPGKGAPPGKDNKPAVSKLHVY